MISSFPKQAMVMAAGLGSRLRPLTLDTPKPLLPISDNGLCCLGLALDHLHQQNMDRIVVNTYYLSDQIESFVRANYPKVIISHEDVPLETGGGFLKALPYFDESAPVLIVNGDTYLQDAPANNLGVAMLADFNPRNDDMLLAVSAKVNGIAFHGPGDYQLNNRRLCYRPNGVSADLVFVSHRVVMPAFVQACANAAEIINNQTHKDCFSFKRCFDIAEANGRLAGYTFDGIWCDLSTVETLTALRCFINERTLCGSISKFKDF